MFFFFFFFFFWGGGTKSLMAGIQGQLKGLGSFRAFDALSCYQSRILKQSAKNGLKKSTIFQNLGEACLLRPHLDPPLCNDLSCVLLFIGTLCVY